MSHLSFKAATIRRNVNLQKSKQLVSIILGKFDVFEKFANSSSVPNLNTKQGFHSFITGLYSLSIQTVTKTVVCHGVLFQENILLQANFKGTSAIKVIDVGSSCFVGKQGIRTSVPKSLPKGSSGAANN